MDLPQAIEARRRRRQKPEVLQGSSLAKARTEPPKERIEAWEYLGGMA
jgi:hypothetical protein